jgi:hypothetical protein
MPVMRTNTYTLEFGIAVSNHIHMSLDMEILFNDLVTVHIFSLKE